MSEPVLRVRELAKAFGGVRAVDGVSFDVASGEVVALIGPNGAGKTTCFNLINGQLVPDAGRIFLGGIDVTGLNARTLARGGVGRTFQVAATFASMTVRENVALALAAHQGATGSIVAAGNARLDAAADALLERVGAHDLAERHAATLAYGDVKRVEIALALAGNPRLLLMDEPTAGMAPRERGTLMRLAADLARRGAIALLFTEHDMDIVFGHADRVIVLDRGRILAEGAPGAIRADPRVQEAYLGVGA
ncbi:MAG: ABC transporter ATP-binding protein [Betaproteobacteria bacterium]